jgi:hypothetical protein
MPSLPQTAQKQRLGRSSECDCGVISIGASSDDGLKGRRYEGKGKCAARMAALPQTATATLQLCISCEGDRAAGEDVFVGAQANRLRHNGNG